MHKTEKYFKQFPDFFSNRKLRDIESVNNFISPSEELISWGKPREDKIPIIKIAELAPNAQRIIDRVGW